MPPLPVLLPSAGPAVAVIVPGLGLSAASYGGLVDALGVAVPTAVVALPAMGLRAEPGAALDPESSADELARRLAEHGLVDGPLVLVGHSASCQVVAELARRHPQTVAGLVLVGPTADPRMSPRRRLVARWLRTVVREDPRRVPGMLRSYATTRLSGFARALRAARRRDLRATLAATTVPVLLVGGPHDHLAPSGWLDALAATRPGIEAVTMTQGAHNLPQTHPVELARHIVTLTRRVCREASRG